MAIDSGAVGFILAVAALGSLAALLCAGLDRIDDLMLTHHQSFKAAVTALLSSGWGRVCLIVHQEQARSDGFLIQDDYPPQVSKP